MGNPGYVYALVNPALEGLVKVGKTTTNPANRANQLSSATGVPMQFMVAYSVIVFDCDLAEKYAHGILEKKGFRVSSNREFFQAPLPVAIEAIKSTASFIGTVTESELLPFSDDSEVDHYYDNSAWLDLELEAYEYWNHGWQAGSHRTHKEYDEHVSKCIALWEKAANAGCVRAYYMLGGVHLDHAEQLLLQINNSRSFTEKLFGDDREKRRNLHIMQGLENHRIALKHGYEMSYAALATYFGDSENISEAKRHWDSFFQSNTFRQRIDPHDQFSLYVICYHNFLHLNLKMDRNEADYLAKQKFDV